jgi:branched-chain amino acid transport system ATP-binding protein
MALLEVGNVRMAYGPIEVLKGVSLSVQAGETFAIIGPNGAGKTTLFKVLTGETGNYSGTIRFGGQDISRLPDYMRARLGFGRTFQVARIFADLSVLNNVVLTIESRLKAVGEPGGAWYSWRPSRAVRSEAVELLESLGFSASFESEAKFLSHGDRKRLEFAIALATNPKILMLDEPTAGMSPSDRKDMTNLLRAAKKARQLTIVMTEHDMDVIFGLADQLMVLNYGEVIRIGTPAVVRDDPLVKEVYLGKGSAHA